MTTAPLIAILPIFVGLGYLVWRAASNPTEKTWETRVAATETWDQLAGPMAAPVPVSA